MTSASKRKGDAAEREAAGILSDQPDQTPWKAIAGLEQNLDLVKMSIASDQGKFETCHRLAAALAMAVESYETARKNTHDKRERERYRRLMEEALAAYRTSESVSSPMPSHPTTSISAVAEALEAATPGPWPEDWVYEAVRHIRRNCDFIGEYSSDPEFNWNDVPDAHLIANAPTWLAQLLAALEEAQQENARLREALENIRDMHAPIDVDPGFCERCTTSWPCTTYNMAAALAPSTGEVDDG